MSGYLQRLAASTARTSSRVHPAVGSLFGGTDREPLSASEPSLAKEPVSERPARVVAGFEAEARRASELPDTDTRSAQNLMPMQFITATRDRAEDSGIQVQELKTQREERVVDGVAFQPLLPAAVADQPHAVRTGQPHVVRVEAAQGEMETAGSEPRWSDKIGATTGHALDDALEHPQELLSPSSSKPALASARQPADFHQQAVRPQTRAEMLPRGHSSQPADDIQIHIGRIEVIAVPPPAPRAAAPVRKALSLDEYLSRRHGGSR